MTGFAMLARSARTYLAVFVWAGAPVRRTVARNDNRPQHGGTAA